MDPRCKVVIVLARMDYSRCSNDSILSDGSKHGAHTMVVIPISSVGVDLVRPLTVFGYDDAPHGEF